MTKQTSVPTRLTLCTMPTRLETSDIGPPSAKPMPSPTAKPEIITAHTRNCVSPTSATPIILPIISWNGLQLLTITSTMRLVFSSITLFIIIAP